MSVCFPISSREEWRQHCRVVAGAGICVATGYGVFPFVASQFVQPLQESLQLSVAAFALAAAGFLTLGRYPAR